MSTAAVIFPIPKQFVNRLLVEKRNVFVKYLARSSLKLSVKNRLLFYVSHSSKEIIGEGTIEEISFLTPSEALLKYGKQLFLDDNELEEYIYLQPNRDSSKQLLVLVLSKIKKYSEPKSINRPVTMAGLCLTKKEYEELLHCLR